MPSAEMLTRLERINRTAIRALGRTFTRYIEVNLGVTVPDLHVGLGAGAIHASLGVEVRGQQFYIE